MPYTLNSRPCAASRPYLRLPLCVLAAVMCLGFAVSAEAETNDRPSWTLQVDPLTAALGYTHLQVERVLAPNWSIYVGPHVRLFDNLVLAEEDEKSFRGQGIEAGVRYYFSGTAPEGGWVLVRGVGARVTQKGEDPVAGGYASALGGYTAIFGGHFVLSGGAGVQYLHYHIAGSGPKTVFVAMHTALGVAF